MMAPNKIGRINPLLEALKASPGRVNKIFVDRDCSSTRMAEVLRLARQNHVPVQFVPRVKLDHLMPGHQGVVALANPAEFTPLGDILASTRRPFLLLLDGVEDPQNLGAILRSAEGAGVDGVLLPERRSVGLTDAVLSAAAGAGEYVPVARVVNLARTMSELKERGIWLVGAEKDGDAPWYEFDYTLPLGLVLGSEGKGLRPLVRKTCDRILTIPQKGKVNSLNVASAASVFLFEVVRQRLHLPPE